GAQVRVGQRPGAARVPRVARAADLGPGRRLVRAACSPRRGAIHGRWSPSAPHTRARDPRVVTYLLDTNACIALINGTPTAVRRRFQRAIAKEATVLVSSVVAFELWYGVAKSQRKETNTQRLLAFLAGPLEWTPFDEEDAREA